MFVATPMCTTTLVGVLFVATPMCTISLYYFSVYLHYSSMCTFCGSSCVLLYHVYYYKIVGVAVLAFWLSLLLPTIK